MEKRSFFERLTGGVNVESFPAGPNFTEPVLAKAQKFTEKQHELPQEEEGQLTIDVWQTPEDIVLQAFVGGVKPDDLDVAVTRDMVTIRGRREKQREITASDYFYQELYWGSFSRSILLPQEVDADEAQATIKHGLLTIHLPKLDKARVAKLKVRNE